MSKWRMRLGLAALLTVLAVVGISWSQGVGPQQQVNPVQLNPPGNVLTLQSAFCQTSTGGAAANTITVPALAGKSIFVTGFEISGLGATSASNITITLAFGGVTVADYQLEIVAGATTTEPFLSVEYAEPIVSPGIGTNCVLTVPSFGTGNTAASVVLHGFYQ